MTARDSHDLLAQVAESVLCGDAHDGAPRRTDLDLDLGRGLRTGLAEVVMGTGKTVDQIAACMQGLAKDGGRALATRVSPQAGRALLEVLPQGSYHARAGLFVLGADLGLDGPQPASGQVMVVTAGTSDMPVALEALGSARFFGLDCGLAADVGVAGIHRLEPHLPALRAARLVLAVAGMDGALPSVLAGLVPTPLVAVPSSQNSDNPLGGLSALLAMLNSCSPGITVCNIDNGFGAAAFAAKLLNSVDGK